MPTNIPEFYSQVVCQWAFGALPYFPVCTFGVSNAADDPPDTVATDVLTAVEQLTIHGISEDAVLGQVIVKNGPTATGPIGFATSSVSGDVGGDIGALQVAVLLKKRTLSGGRKNQGRMFLPFVSEAVVDPGGQLQSAFRSDLQDAATDFLADLGAADHPMVIFHDDESTPTTVTSLLVDQTVATQRRRQRR